MSTTLLFDLFHNQTHVLEQAVQSWKPEQAPTISVHDVEDVVKECLCFPADMRRACDAICDRLATNQLESFEEAGRGLESLFDEKLRVLESVRLWVREMAQVGRSIRQAPELDHAAEELLRLKKSMLEFWPWYDPEEMQEALESVRRGEGQTIEEILDELFRKQGKAHPDKH
jgi:hypothetical protein